MAKKVSKEVDWKALKTAKGPASRVPALVKVLVDGKTPQDRSTAYWTLQQGLHVNGVLTSSVPPTVALLLDVFATRKEGAHRAAWLIGEALAAGHDRLLADAEASVGGPADEAQAAVEAHKDVLLSALADPDERVRSAAAFALAWAPSVADVSRPALRKQVGAEVGDAAKLSELLAIGLLGHSHPTPDDAHVIQAARGGKSPVARGAGALANLLLTSKTSPDDGDDIAALLQSAVDPEMLPWRDGNLGRLLVSVATRIDARSELAVAVASKLDAQAPPKSWVPATEALLELGGFAKQWPEREVALPEELSEAQRGIATGLARREGIEGIRWGVPRSARDRRRWLGLTPPGALEKRIPFQHEGTERQWPVWKVWQTAVGASRVTDVPQAVLEALSPDETLEAYAEVHLGAYMIAFNKQRPALEPVFKVAPRATPKAAEWARRFSKEVLALLEAKSTPELGGALGFFGADAVYLAILGSGGALEPWLYDAFPASPSYLTEWLLEKLGPEQGEAVVWQWMNQPSVADSKSVAVSCVTPLLERVPSKRIAQFLLAALKEPAVIESLGNEGTEQSLAKIRAIAEKHPAVATSTHTRP
jgi:hypothetical protein